MQPEGRDISYLWDMVTYARIAMELTEKCPVDAYLRDRTQQLALERALEIVGEAARRVSGSFRDSHPEIPWKRIVGNCNILTHNYDDVIPEVVWTTATREVPKLVAALLVLLPAEPE